MQGVFKGTFIAGKRLTTQALKLQDEAFFASNVIPNRLHYPLAGVGPIAWVNIDVLAVQTERAMIAAACLRRLHLGSAHFAGEALVDMGKSW